MARFCQEAGEPVWDSSFHISPFRDVVFSYSPTVKLAGQDAPLSVTWGPGCSDESVRILKTGEGKFVSRVSEEDCSTERLVLEDPHSARLVL